MVSDQNQIRAFTDDEARRQYILSQISDVNLHKYANQAIQHYIDTHTFTYPDKSNADNKRILAQQIAAITDVARKLQLEDSIKAAKAS